MKKDALEKAVEAVTKELRAKQARVEELLKSQSELHARAQFAERRMAALLIEAEANATALARFGQSPMAMTI